MDIEKRIESQLEFLRQYEKSKASDLNLCVENTRTLLNGTFDDKYVAKHIVGFAQKVKANYIELENIRSRIEVLEWLKQ